MKEIISMENSSLKEKLLTDFTYQSQCRWYSESEKLKLQLESFMHKVLESNYYEGNKLYRMLSHAIEETINEAMKIRFISIILKIIFDRRWGEELGAD